MQSNAASVEEYIASLPEDRRAAIEEVRKVILANLDHEYAEGMSYGMIGYYVPHSVYPKGYHCDPTKPLPFAGLASQKNHMSLYLMCVYMSPEREAALRAAWAKTGKKLDMGKSCIRFKKAEDLALEVIADTIRAVPARTYIEHMEAALARRAGGTASGSGSAAGTRSAGGGTKPAKKAAEKAARTTVKKAAKKAVKKAVKKSAATARRAGTRGSRA